MQQFFIEENNKTYQHTHHHINTHRHPITHFYSQLYTHTKNTHLYYSKEINFFAKNILKKKSKKKKSFLYKENKQSE